jgi:hypothetical protein
MPEEEDSFNDSEDANAGPEIIAAPEGAPVEWCIYQQCLTKILI